MTKIDGGNIENGFQISIEGEKKQVIVAKRVIIATGTCSSELSGFNIDHKKILTSFDILAPDFNIVPKRLLIVGAGYVGCEFANIFASFGSKVTCLEYLPSPLITEEPKVIKKMIKNLNSKGVEVHTSHNVLHVETTESGVKVTTVSTDVQKDQIDTAEKSIFEADICLISIGRTKESHNIGLEEIGVETKRDAIQVNSKTLETSVQGIYAIGDVTGGLMLAHVASYEAKIAVCNALESIGGFPVKRIRVRRSIL